MLRALALRAMMTSEYHEGLWEAVPEGLRPPDFARRLAFLLARTAIGENVLDVGCGEASFSSELHRAGRVVVGVDVAEEPLRRGRARQPELDLRLISLAGSWPFEDSSFDVVWAGEVIEHVADVAPWLSELRRVLRPRGTLLLTTPHHGRGTLLRLALSRRRFAEHFEPRSDHLRFYSPRTLAALLDDLGFDVADLRCAGGPPGLRSTILARATRG
jgi:2-polyprenyl-3-methyl-5-hydroxy-6-metoxy-1,4-benzoquinol methylase